MLWVSLWVNETQEREGGVGSSERMGEPREIREHYNSNIEGNPESHLTYVETQGFTVKIL